MKIVVFFVTVMCFAGQFKAQNITFKGCVPLFEDQQFLFSKSSTDANGKGIYITSPVTGDQPCGGLGTCEFMIQWNKSQTRWELLADSGNGDFLNPYLMFYNSTGNNSASNPPSNIVGTWIENTSVTEGFCGGNLSATNSILTGDVHTSTLSVLDDRVGKIQFFPNPVKEFLTVSGIDGDVFAIYEMSGKIVMTGKFSVRTDIRNLKEGIYFYKITDKIGNHNEFKFIKK